MNILYLDIETIPGQNAYIREDIAASIKAPGQYKKQESIDKWLDDNRESAADAKWRSTSFSGALGEIVCIGWAINEDEPQSVQRELGQSERDMLCAFFDAVMKSLGERIDGTSITPDVWVGHNITGFDLRFIWQRCIINKFKPPIKLPVNAKYWDAIIFDTMFEWRGGSAKAGGSLNEICKALGIETKGDIDGSNVWDYVKDGRTNEVSEYCKKDVMRTREIYNIIS